MEMEQRGDSNHDKNRRAGATYSQGGQTQVGQSTGRPGQALLLVLAVISRRREAWTMSMVRMDVDADVDGWVWRKRWGDKNLANGDGGEGRDRGVAASTAPAWV